MLHHGPDAWGVAAREQNLPVVAAEKLIPEINQSGRNVYPHERQVPLQRTAEPASDCKGLRPMQQIFLRDLGAEAGKRAKDLQAAAHQHEQRDRIHPVTQANGQRMFINGAANDLSLVTCLADDFHYCAAHAVSEELSNDDC